MDSDARAATVAAAVCDLLDTTARECRGIAAACSDEAAKATRLARGLNDARSRRSLELLAAEHTGGANIAERIADALTAATAARREAHGL